MGRIKWEPTGLPSGRSWPGKSSFRYFPSSPHSPCSSADSRSATPAFAPRSTALLATRTLSSLPPASRSLTPPPPLPAPILASRSSQTAHPPTPFSSGDSTHGGAPAPLSPRHSPGCPPGGPTDPRATRAYRRSKCACGLSPAWRHHSLWAPFFRGLDALAVQNPGAGCRFFAGLGSHPFPQSIMNAHPSAVFAPTPVIPPHRPVRGKVVGQQPPGDPTAHEIAEGVDQFAHIGLAVAASGLARWNEGLDNSPLFVGQVRGVGFAFHTPVLSSMSLPIQPLRNSASHSSSPAIRQRLAAFPSLSSLP